MFSISGGFVGSFKIGDNINHSLKVISLLYGVYEKSQEEDRKLLCKPIIIMLASLIEAVLYDFINYRIRSHTSEGVANIAQNYINEIQAYKKIDKFNKCIEVCLKYDLLYAEKSLYSALADLCKLRNRVHLQNARNIFEADDQQAFTIRRKRVTEILIEKIFRQMTVYYLRPLHIHKYVEDFIFPWESHIV